MHQCEIKFNSLFLLWLSHSFNAAASKAMLFFYGGNRWKEAAVWPTITCEGVITVIFESKTTFPRVSNSRTNDKILQTNIFASEIFFLLLLLFFFSDFVISRFFFPVEIFHTKCWLRMQTFISGDAGDTHTKVIDWIHSLMEHSNWLFSVGLTPSKYPPFQAIRNQGVLHS